MILRKPEARLTILVVDDHADILRLVSLMLRRDGFKVLTATTPQEAMAIDGCVDILISDVVFMPGPVDGKQLAEVLLRRRPAMKVIIVSGYPQYAEAIHPKWGFLMKPFTAQELCAKVREVGIQ